MKRTKHILSIIAFFTSICVGIAAMFIPPPGIIDQSILWWIAQLLAFTAGILGIELNINGLAKTTKHGKNEDD